MGILQLRFSSRFLSSDLAVEDSQKDVGTNPMEAMTQLLSLEPIIVPVSVFPRKSPPSRLPAALEPPPPHPMLKVVFGVHVTAAVAELAVVLRLAMRF